MSFFGRTALSFPFHLSGNPFIGFGFLTPEKRIFIKIMADFQDELNNLPKNGLYKIAVHPDLPEFEMRYWKYFLLSFVIILIDQASKLLVHYNMEMGPMGEIIVIEDWFRLHYLLNPGMAFGFEFDAEYGKLFLSIFRIIASAAIAWGIISLHNKQAHKGFITCIALILGGALGNVIDSVFYGVFLEGNMIPGSSTPWFHGQVIDMLYFPMFEGRFPLWMPIWGGEYFLFFSPVFNIADSAIFVGVTTILIFQNRFTAQHFEQPAAKAANAETAHVHTTTDAEASIQSGTSEDMAAAEEADFLQPMPVMQKTTAQSGNANPENQS